MSSHDIRDMTARHDFISIKLDIIWLLLYVAVSELERWFYICLARYLRQGIHSNNRRLRDLHACLQRDPETEGSRHVLRDFCYFCLCRTIATCVTLTYNLETQGQIMAYVMFLIPACMCPTAMIFLFCQVFRSNPTNQHKFIAVGQTHAEITKVTYYYYYRDPWPWRDLQFQGHAWRSPKRREFGMTVGEGLFCFFRPMLFQYTFFRSTGLVSQTCDLVSHSTWLGW